jgi:hypothetical protein
MKNLKTTLAGLVAGIPMAVDALMTAYNSGAFTGKSGFQLAVAIAIVLLGYLASDKKKTI